MHIMYISNVSECANELILPFFLFIQSKCIMDILMLIWSLMSGDLIIYHLNLQVTQYSFKGHLQYYTSYVVNIQFIS